MMSLRSARCVLVLDSNDHTDLFDAVAEMTDLAARACPTLTPYKADALRSAARTLQHLANMMSEDSVPYPEAER